MAGTSAGAAKAVATNKKKHGKDFYAKIGAMGGKALGCKGFAANPELARTAGAMGGKISRRGRSESRARRVKEAKQMKAEGKTITEIARYFGVAYNTALLYVGEE